MPPEVKLKRTYNASLRREQAQMTRQRIIDAGRRLLAAGTYTSVTMEGVAAEAGVSCQTVYAVFKTKPGLAQAIVETGWPHVEEARGLMAGARGSSDPELWLRTTARVARQILEPCAEMMRFMRESGDNVLRARYTRVEAERLDDLREVAVAVRASGRCQPGLSAEELLDVLWSLTSAELFAQMVFTRGWAPARYEQWLGEALLRLLLVT